MSQHDLSIANQGFPAFRSDLNDALQALGSMQSGTSAPSTTYANMLWYDTTNNIVKMRNEDNDAWISLFTLDQSGDLVSAISAATGTFGTLSATGNVTLGDSSSDTATVNAKTTFGSEISAPNTFGFKNRIINGSMVIDQRNAGASITPIDGSFPADRWRCGLTAASKFTAQQVTTAPAGFSNSLKATSSSSYSVGSSDEFEFIQNIEGNNIVDLAFGTPSAKSITISFWVQCSLTGTFGGSLINSDASRCYPFSYSIPAANTWTYITVTVAGDTSGTWGTGTGKGLSVFFSLGAGSSVVGTAGSWGSTFYRGVTGQTNLVGTSGATFYITGVQLEKGSTATSFDYRPYGTELAFCQRYYQKSYSASTVPASATFVGMEWHSINPTYPGRIANTTHLVQSMRDAPSITPYDQAGTANRVRTSVGNGQTGYNIQTVSTEKFVMDYNASISELLYHWTASAEL